MANKIIFNKGCSFTIVLLPIHLSVLFLRITFIIIFLLCRCPGSEECPFPYPLHDSKDCSPDSPVTPSSRPHTVHSGTQTEGPQVFAAAPEACRIQPCLLVPAAPPLTSCPSPVPQRKQRHCAKWENRASVVQTAKEAEEDKPSYESLETVSISIMLTLFCYIVLRYATCYVTSTWSACFPGQPEAAENQWDTT